MQLAAILTAVTAFLSLSLFFLSFFFFLLSSYLITY